MTWYNITLSCTVCYRSIDSVMIRKPRGFIQLAHRKVLSIHHCPLLAKALARARLSDRDFAVAHSPFCGPDFEVLTCWVVCAGWVILSSQQSCRRSRWVTHSLTVHLQSICQVFVSLHTTPLHSTTALLHTAFLHTALALDCVGMYWLREWSNACADGSLFLAFHELPSIPLHAIERETEVKKVTRKLYWFLTVRKSATQGYESIRHDIYKSSMSRSRYDGNVQRYDTIRYETVRFDT